MKQHQYRVTLEYLADQNGNPVACAPIVFDAPNHDEIFGLIEKVRERTGLPEDQARRFLVGLKLMGEVMLENKDHAFFARLMPTFRALMQEVKQR